ncbi:MAG TPA: hypothetical protein DCE42_07040 [Myxococcales bacterium]|nr:hypothetical protein [Deltaproteobacteria bacterium]MBU50862.1 hypothetical protein [Deltaproteobacteria bacterium]HAA54494.1 hypothetical protein [Myxococcales bacterium]
MKRVTRFHPPPKKGLLRLKHTKGFDPMKTSLTLSGECWQADLAHPIDISIPLDFFGAQPGAFGIQRAAAQPYTVGEFVLDTREGGSVNCFNVQLNPHGNGTHTECVGHILNKRIYINDILKQPMFPVRLVTVTPRTCASVDDKVHGPSTPEDLVIDVESLTSVLSKESVPTGGGVVLRTLPNEVGKQSRSYRQKRPAYLTPASMTYLVLLGVCHLLLDVPSVDRDDDDGALVAHHLFWEVPQGSHEVVGEVSTKTITEMVYIPEEVPDGLYLANLQIPSFCLDAAPSRPLLYRMEQVPS